MISSLRNINCFSVSLLVKWNGRGHRYLLNARTLHNLEKSNKNSAFFEDFKIVNKIGCNAFETRNFTDIVKRYVHTSSFFNKSELNSTLDTTRKSAHDVGILQQIKGVTTPYFKLMRYDKLTGTYLLYIPCTWSIILSYDPAITTMYETSKILGLFLVGAYIMRSAGCIINDMLDRDIDRKISRTKDRPLACDRLTNKQALVLLAAHLSAGLTILLQLNWLSVFVGAPSVILVALYPLAKRYTHFAQVVLGSVFSWGAILGSTAITGSVLPGTVVPLYLAALCWIVHYDTIYAHQDRKEDVQIGLKSSAILLSGKAPESTPEGRIRLRTALGSLTSLTMTGCGWSILNATQDAVSPGLTLLLLTPAISHFVWQISTLQEDKPDDCLQKFKSNVHVGLLVLAAIITAKIIQSKKQKPENILAIDELVLA